jgi:hypothetical protein
MIEKLRRKKQQQKTQTNILSPEFHKTFTLYKN